MEVSNHNRGQDATFVRGAFANIAKRYVLTNHVLSFGIDILWRWKTARLVAELHPEIVLDLATGSGDLAMEIKRQCPVADVLGADFSPPMLQEAKKNGMQNLIVADALNLPITDASIDIVTVAFGLRNMASWSDALTEMARVLRPGGALFVLDFSLPENSLMRSAHLFYLRQVMPLIAGALTGERQAYEYLCKTIEQFPSGDAMCCLICQNGFREAKAIKLSFGIASIYIAVK